MEKKNNFIYDMHVNSCEQIETAYYFWNFILVMMPTKPLLVYWVTIQKYRVSLKRRPFL